ncbi:TetR/AcrR family transcriptional regulator [Henriciella aquimarina]|uniref:TetR/AcrR family transcriptional regulator n=1 Tax=Henriciella aquimarina TaxID=545261 RepID=UPI0009FEA01D|nr:TetR/AcrR family transcriptional regulator [Henriciella aquimarina]
MLRARTDEAKDERRHALLGAALDEFFEKGFAAARMVDVARRAGLSKGTLYLYFDSKEAMFRALIETLTKPSIDQLEQMAEAAHSLEETFLGLRQFAPVIIRETDVPRLMKVLIGDSHTFPEIVRAYRMQLIERVLGIMTAVLRRAHKAGEIHVAAPELTARLVVAPIIMSGIWQALFSDEPDAAVDLDALFRLHTDLLLKALKTGDPS